MRQLTITFNLPDFDKLKSENMQKDLEYRATLSLARSLQESIKQSLLNKVPKANQHNPKYTDTMMDAIRITKANMTNSDRVVHALGVRDKGSGTYRARFFDKTTKPRYQKTLHGKKLKKKRYVGQISGTNFFQDGISQLNTQPTMNFIQRYIQNKINESIK